MTDPVRSIVARADALMQRRRQGAVPLDDVPVLTDAVDHDDDLPVLSPEIDESQPAATPTENAELAARAALAEELAERVRAKLLAEIPHLIHVAVSELLEEYERKADHDSLR